MTSLGVIPPSECDEHGVPLDWERCRTCRNGLPSHPDDPNQGDCATCDGHGSLKAAALADLLDLRCTAHDVAKLAESDGPFEPMDGGKVRCEDCGHPMSDGTWEVSTGLAPPYDHLFHVALRELRDGREPMLPGCVQPSHEGIAHYSPCDEGCRHGGSGRMDGPGGPDGASMWMSFGAGVTPEQWRQQATPTLRAGVAVEASWRPVDVRCLSWPHDLRPEMLGVLCLRCYADA